MKTVNFKPVKPTSSDEWVRNAKPIDREEAPRPSEPTKRFTIDVPIELHRRIKIACADRGLKMADVLRDIFEREFPKT